MIKRHVFYFKIKNLNDLYAHLTNYSGSRFIKNFKSDSKSKYIFLELLRLFFYKYTEYYSHLNCYINFKHKNLI